MTFPTSIQSLVGTHVAVPGQIVPDWPRNTAFIYGSITGTFYLSSVGILTGLEQAFINTASYTTPGSVTGAAPICVDSSGNPYTTWFSGRGGGLIKSDKTTLAQLATGGGAGSPPDGWFLVGGSLSNIPVSGTDFFVALQEGSGGSIIRGVVAYNGVTFAGRYEIYGTGNDVATCCAGKTGSNLAFVVAAPHAGTDPQTMFVYKMSFTPGGTWTIADWPTQNSLVTFATLATLVPIDIDAGWTEIFQWGICVDQTDGNPMVWCYTSNTVAGYIVKLDQSTGAIIWKCPVPALHFSASSNQQFGFSRVNNQTLCIITASPTTITTINTSDGSSTSYTSNLAGFTIVYGQQCFDSASGGIILRTTFSATTGSPTLLNSTASSFTAWAMLYVAPVPPAPTNPRRFLSESGPIRLGFSTPAAPSYPPLPPLPPPPTPPPATVTNITTLAGDPLITLSGSNIITDT